MLFAFEQEESIWEVKNDEKVYDPRKVIGPGKKGIANVVETKCKVFGCIGKAF